MLRKHLMMHLPPVFTRSGLPKGGQVEVRARGTFDSKQVVLLRREFNFGRGLYASLAPHGAFPSCFHTFCVPQRGSGGGAGARSLRFKTGGFISTRAPIAGGFVCFVNTS